jgi:hypothetical protein
VDIKENWNTVRELFKQSFASSFHYAIASVNEDGSPHITPIGSLVLGKPGRGLYFEKFPRQLPQNLQSNQKVCVLAVNSSKWFWLKSLLRGRFPSPPAVRLHGTVGEKREATEEELARWGKRVQRVGFTRGHAIMWRGMSKVRDIEFTRIDPVQIGAMTRDAWNAPSDKDQP